MSKAPAEPAGVIPGSGHAPGKQAWKDQERIQIPGRRRVRGEGALGCPAPPALASSGGRVPPSSVLGLAGRVGCHPFARLPHSANQVSHCLVWDI